MYRDREDEEIEKNTEEIDELLHELLEDDDDDE